MYNNVNLPKKSIDDIINGLITIKVINKKDNKFKVNFPTFYEKDIKLIIRTIQRDVEVLARKVKEFCTKLNYSKEELYHLICNDVLDNYAFDYLVDKRMITNDKINYGNRNYIIIGYEKTKYIDNYSNKLLCSNNRYNCGKVTFNSFGDTDGFRNDFFRYFRLRQINIIESKEIDDYFKMYNEDQDIMKSKLEKIVLRIEEDKETFELLNKLGYMKDNHINVPIIKRSEHLSFAKELMDTIVVDINNILNKLRNNKLIANLNEVPFEDTANELWHIIFGLINEYLVKENTVGEPKYYENEGRYLRCIYLESE